MERRNQPATGRLGFILFESPAAKRADTPVGVSALFGDALYLINKEFFP